MLKLGDDEKQNLWIVSKFLLSWHFIAGKDNKTLAEEIGRKLHQSLSSNFLNQC